MGDSEVTETMLQLVQVHINNPMSYSVLKDFIDRAIHFSREWLHSDADDNILIIDLMHNFFSENSSKLMLALVDEDNHIMAHLIAQIDHYYGMIYLTINHYWRDPNVPLGEHQRYAIWNKIRTWGQEMGAKKIRAFARNPEVVAAFEKYNLLPTGVSIVEGDLE